MREYVNLSVLVILLTISSCDKMDLPSTVSNASKNTDYNVREIGTGASTHGTNGITIGPDLSFEELENLSKKFNEFKAANEARHQKSIINSLNADCRQTVYVPDDYSTIQEAIDAVCENGNVFVRSGVYLESPGILKKGLFIKAIGDVTVNGGFGLEADNVKIHGFKIDNSYSEWSGVGIASSPGYNGFDIEHNTIHSSGISYPGNPLSAAHFGILLQMSENSTIAQNNISGAMEMGIFISSFALLDPSTFGSSSNNTISNNTITDIFGDINRFYPGHGIILYGNCDNNKLEGNIVNTSNGWGLSLNSLEVNNFKCDNNIVRNNIIRNHLFTGIEIVVGGSNNTIGPNNIINDNGNGIFISYESSNNIIFNNNVKNNATCDIVNQGTSNTFKNNTAGCTIGVN